MTGFEALVDQIYEAAVDPELWPRTLYDLGRVVDAAGGIIVTRRADAWLGWRYSEAMRPGADAFLSGPMRTEATPRLLALNRAGFVSEDEVFTAEEYLADPLMTDWATPAGLHHATATAIPVPTGDFVLLQFNRRIGEPRFTANDLARLDAFRPHLARAGLLAARWRLERLRAATEALAVMGLPAAVIDACGRILSANSLIESLNSHVAWLPKDRIGLVDPAANDLLSVAVSSLADPAAPAARSFPSRGTGDNRAVIHVIPFTGQARDLFGGFGALIVTPLAAPSAPEATLIQGLFDLTPAEARVAQAVVQRKTVERMAEEFDVSRETIRTQMKSVLAKTGSARQLDLAMTLAATNLNVKGG